VCSTQAQAPGHTIKHLFVGMAFARHKFYINLLQTFVNYRCKKIYKKGSRRISTAESYSLFNASTDKLLLLLTHCLIHKLFHQCLATLLVLVASSLAKSVASFCFQMATRAPRYILQCLFSEKSKNAHNSTTTKAIEK
jgi:hypothetical protein